MANFEGIPKTFRSIVNAHNWGFINLSRKYGQVTVVPTSRKEQKSMKLPQVQVFDVRGLTSCKVVQAGMKELPLAKMGAEDGNRLIEQKFSGIIGDKVESEPPKHVISDELFFERKIQTLEENLMKVEGEPWVKITKGLEPLRFADEKEVVDALMAERARLQKHVNFIGLASGISAASFAFVVISDIVNNLVTPYDARLAGVAVMMIGMAFGSRIGYNQYGKALDAYQAETANK